MPLSIFQIGFRQRIGGEADRLCVCEIPQLGRIAVGEVQQFVFTVAIKGIDHTVALARLSAQIEQDVCAHGGTEDDAVVGRGVWFDRVAIDGNHLRCMTLELKTENACVGSVDQAQTDAFAGADVEVAGNAAVHRDCVSDAAVVSDVVQVIEIVLD